jgi:hypothetical protein
MFKTLILLIVGYCATTSTWGKPMLIDNFDDKSEKCWSYISDQVMGGISQGTLTFEEKQDIPYARLTGIVSTENKGGFIQFRTSLHNINTKSVDGIYINVKGNNQKYYLHLRTKGTFLPWQYYQAEFDVSENWQTIKLPLENFVASSGWLRKKVKSASIESIGVVAFGRDHIADISVSEIGFY